VECLEHYSRRHSETVDDLLDWPWLRFERFYNAFVVGEAVERMENLRDMIIAGLYANSVYDEHEEAKRDEAIQMIESSYSNAIDYLKARAAGEDTDEDESDDFDEDDPFWKPVARAEAALNAPRADEADMDVTAGEVVDGEAAAEDIRDIMKDLDQS
jgi:hypothetical protein